MNNITVYWIEDNPIISNEEEINGLNFPKLLHKDFFTYYLFQHPKQVEEYLTMINILTSNDGITSIAKNCPAALPDIVVFDYKMFDAFSRNTNALQYSNQEHFNFLQTTSVNHQIKNCYPKLFETQALFLEREDVKKGEYMGDKFKNELKAAAIESDDEFGLYSGIAIIREFKDYITFGVPATINKADKSRMSYNSLFYEWINSYDLKGTIERPVQDAANESKDWDNILKFAIDRLRKRIVAQMQSCKITLMYYQLVELAERVPSEIAKRNLTFQSYYGERTLSLDGLFFDETDLVTRDEKIKAWACELLEKMPLSNSVIKKSIDLSTQLWNAYLNCFEDRMILSDYTYRLAELNDVEKEYLVQVKKRLDFDDTTGLIAKDKQISIRTLLDKEDVEVKRLTVLHAITDANIQLEKQRIESGHNEKYSPLSEWENFNILFPKANLTDQILLPMHFEDETPKGVITEKDRKWMFRNLTTKENKVSEGNLFQFVKWISKGEKEVLKSIFYKEKKYYPEWLK